MRTMMATNGITSILDVVKALSIDVRREYGNEIVGCCPVHESRTGKADGSPSWSINSTSGLWLCHSCGARGNLPQLISEITGDYESVTSIYSLMINNGMEQLQSTAEVQVVKKADWSTYLSYAKPPQQQLDKRNLKSTVATKYGIRWDTIKNSWIIPIVSQTGELLGWQEKAPDYVRNYPVGVVKSSTLFGADVFNSKIGILVESPLDVVRFASAFNGVQCLASFGVNVSNTQINMLYELCDQLIIGLDNDKAGIQVGIKLFRSLPPFRGGVKWLSYKHTKAKDIGEMTNEEIKEAVFQASALPWWL